MKATTPKLDSVGDANRPPVKTTVVATTTAVALLWQQVVEVEVVVMETEERFRRVRLLVSCIRIRSVRDRPISCRTCRRRPLLLRGGRGRPLPEATMKKKKKRRKVCAEVEAQEGWLRL